MNEHLAQDGQISYLVIQNKRHYEFTRDDCFKKVDILCISKGSLSNSKIFASAKNCRRKSKIIELASAII